MKPAIVFFLLLKISAVVAQTATNSAGSGNFNNTATWTSPKDLTGTANILTGHTITIPSTSTFYASKITFAGTGKLLLTNGSSRWLPSTSVNVSPPEESSSNASNWSASTVWVSDPFGGGSNHYTPWINSGQAWSASTANSGTDYLQYDLQSAQWVQGIVTQGRANMAQWVTKAKIEVSTDVANNWVVVYSDRTLNTDGNTKVYVNFPKVMFARYIRVTPALGGVNGHASMRMGILLRDNVLKSCKEILATFPASTSGVYSIDPDGSAGALPATSCYCDMETDGGGWTLVLNYLHLAGTNPALNVRTNSLPVQGSTTLGTDEQGTSYWGHASNSYLNNFTFSDVRFYGKSSSHSRVLHFKTSHANTISYFMTGTGSMDSFTYTLLASHSAVTPGGTLSYYTNRGNSAMTEFPFYIGAANHWGIKGGTYRWEMDDYPAISGSGYQNHTLHQIWIR